MCLVKLLAILIVGVVGLPDRKFQTCDILEHNICYDHRTGKERFTQIVAWDKVNGHLFTCGWCFSSNYKAVYKIDDGYVVVFESGHIIKTRMLYNSVTPYDVEIDGRMDEEDKEFKYFYKNVFLQQ